MFNRQIFGPYFNGAEPVFSDPLAAYRKIHYGCSGDPDKVIADSKSEDVGVSYQAKEKLLKVARFAFGMIPFDPKTGQGAQDEDCWGVLNAFLDWVDKKKVTEEKPPNSQPSTEQISSLSPSTTTPFAACGLTSLACGCKGQ